MEKIYSRILNKEELLQIKTRFLHSQIMFVAAFEPERWKVLPAAPKLATK